ncbi:MAG: hypothetical protein MH825_05940 [Cyanobacteria bacterium]|nr:hypothetical protein [Cyanobacteriota bacterium]
MFPLPFSPARPAAIALAALALTGCSTVQSWLGRFAPEPAPETPAAAIAPSPSPSASPSPKADPTAGWTRYASSKGGYAVLFPGEPAEEVAKIPTPAGETEVVLVRYQDRKNGRLYLFTHNRVPVPQGSSLDIEKGLDSSRDSLARGMDGKAIAERKITQNGFPGREVEFDRAGKFAAKARIFYANGILYQAIVGTEDRNLKAPSVNLFLNSIKVAGSPEKPPS